LFASKIGLAPQQVLFAEEAQQSADRERAFFKCCGKAVSSGIKTAAFKNRGIVDHPKLA
jgi:hypothetical protein